MNIIDIEKKYSALRDELDLNNYSSLAIVVEMPTKTKGGCIMGTKCGNSEDISCAIASAMEKSKDLRSILINAVTMFIGENAESMRVDERDNPN